MTAYQLDLYSRLCSSSEEVYGKRRSFSSALSRIVEPSPWGSVVWGNFDVSRSCRQVGRSRGLAWQATSFRA